MSGNIETISLWAYLSSDSTQTILDKLCLYGYTVFRLPVVTNHKTWRLNSIQNYD